MTEPGYPPSTPRLTPLTSSLTSSSTPPASTAALTPSTESSAGPVDPTTLQAHATPTYAKDPRWPALVLRFNLDLAAYADASWLSTHVAVAAGASATAGNSRLRAALSAALLAEHQLHQRFDWELANPAARLFLLPAEMLSQIARVIGLATHRNSLRQLVRQQQLTLLRQAVGDSWDALWLPFVEAVPLNHVGKHGALFEPLPLQWTAFDPALLCRRLKQDGLRQLLRLLDARQPTQAASAQRAALCVPRALAQAALPPLSDTAAQRLVCATTEQIIPRWASAWTWLF